MLLPPARSCTSATKTNNNFPNGTPFTFTLTAIKLTSMTSELSAMDNDYTPDPHTREQNGTRTGANCQFQRIRIGKNCAKWYRLLHRVPRVPRLLCKRCVFFLSVSIFCIRGFCYILTSRVTAFVFCHTRARSLATSGLPSPDRQH